MQSTALVLENKVKATNRKYMKQNADQFGNCTKESQTKPTRQSANCCRSDALEQSATRYYWLCVTDIILLDIADVFVFYIISMTTFFFLVVLEVFT